MYYNLIIILLFFTWLETILILSCISCLFCSYAVGLTTPTLASRIRMGLYLFIRLLDRNVSRISSTCLLLIDHFLLFYAVERHYDSMLSLSYFVHRSILYLSILHYSCFLPVLLPMVDCCCITCGGSSGLGRRSTL